MFEIEEILQTANISRTIRFTETLFERLNKTAQENHISFNKLVLLCCQHSLNDMDQTE